MSNVKQVLEEILQAQKDYYTSGESSLTDKEFDEKLEWLKENDEDAYNQIMLVGSDLSDDKHWKKVKHKVPLGSLSKCNTFEEFKEWAKKFDTGFIVDEKLDGISIALYYSKGKLVKAVTRGNGEIGDDILRNVKKMNGVPTLLEYDKDCIVRGEIILKHSDFEKLPTDKKGKNPRNTAAGASKKLDGDLCDKLTVIVYDVLDGDKELISKFPFTVKRKFFKTTKDILNYYVDYVNTTRNHLDWDIDGLVIKATGEHEVGDWKKPKNAIAWKFPHQAAKTNITKIRWQVSGARVNPIAEFQPVDIAGVTVSKASLHNWSYVHKLGITPHCKVEVTRRNDVIPHVEQVLEKAPKNYCIEIPKPPEKCPCCGGKVDFERNTNGEELEYLVCTNISCPAKAIKNVLKWFEVHDCKGVAEKTVELIHTEIGFNNLFDFIYIIDNQTDDILKLNGMGNSKVNNIQEQIDLTRKTTSLEKFYGGLNMNGFGRRMFRKVVDHILTLQDSVNWKQMYNFMIDEEKMVEVEGFSDSSAASLKLQLTALKDLINKLYNSNIVPPEEKKKNGDLAGLSFCFTGSLDTMKRSDAEKIVVEKCGKIGTVNKNLTYLVTNDTESGSSKNKKAKDLGVKIINEKQFLELIK